MLECSCIAGSDDINWVGDATNDVSVQCGIERGEFLTSVRSGRDGIVLVVRVLYVLLVLVIRASAKVRSPTWYT